MRLRGSWMGWTTWFSLCQSTALVPLKLWLPGSQTRWHLHTGEPTQRLLWVQNFNFSSTFSVSVLLLSLCILHHFFLPLRPAMDVRRCLKTQKGSITAAHVVRVSAIPAPATGCPCQREAGAAVLLGCVRPATNREGHLTLTARVRHTVHQPTCA